MTIIEPGIGRLENQRLTVVDEHIAQLEAEPGAAFEDGPISENLDDLQGTFVLPGLIDLHVHFPPDNPLHLSSYFNLLFLSHGVTTVRDAGDMDGTAVAAARRAIQEGEGPGPRIFGCGPFVTGGPSRWANVLILEGPDDAEAAVARIAADGWACVKAYDDLSADEIAAITVAAKRHGLPVIGHVPTAVAYEDALLPGPQHLLGVPRPEALDRDHIVDRLGTWHNVDDERMDLIVNVTLEHGLINTPTLSMSHQLLGLGDYEAARRQPAAQLMPRLYPDVVWNPSTGLPFYRDITPDQFAMLHDAYDKKRELVRRLWQAGAPLRLGTDTQQPFVVPGISLHQEMRIFAELGIPLEEIWTMATRKAAEDLRPRLPGDLEALGTLTVGAPADLLIYRRDPTLDLDALDSLEAVIVGGRLWRIADLKRAIDAHRRHHESWIFDRVSVAVTRQIMERTVLRDF